MNRLRPTWKIVRRPILSASGAGEHQQAGEDDRVRRRRSTAGRRPLVCSDFPISGRPTFTIVLSSPTMNRAEQQTARTIARAAGTDGYSQ